ncbi:M14 family metallopeptidase [Christiangramia forsetii]|uniref:Secreted peptidase, family M14 n=2 Tax=Christiangramia forsetii TaxID=411153 RepID=A0M4E2_CHRFK|nr:M14 family metallopeptidase [Christiangramia forsetii]GGG23617.1 peptidase M14 [Christiangramia forsetii]CAL67487.1 secreted peptidase, family M14 [Christiangramia forsetii KT0803]
MRISTTIIFLFSFLFIQAQDQEITLDYYLPADISYNSEIPTPQEVIGFIPGEWHVSHDRLLMYINKLAEVSPRIQIENRGFTYEGRQLALLVISSEENLENIENIRKEHVSLVENDSESLNTEAMPIVINQGFSIHGNEASGSNSALLYAYYLAAAEGDEIEKVLDNTVILLDPAFNPDGLQRFAYWANTNKSENINPDPQDREYSEVWPGGRTNHYWFDMNRDWLPVQLPESQARIATFHKWYPNILTDHHEMGSNSTFFFQPGIPSRTHPLTPKMNQDLTREIGTYHAEALDEIGSLYYTEENYDDFYYGKGSTFPDINGSVGILFEQGSSRGHAQETENGILTFPFTIRNQFTAALSTLEASQHMREDLLNYQRNFFKESRDSAESGAYAFGNSHDPFSAYKLAEILKRHKIEVYELKDNFSQQDENFEKGSAYIVPKNQRQHRLLKAMFEKRTEFRDSLFYDISAWTFPLAFNLDFTEEAAMKNAGSKVEELSPISPELPEESDYAYLLNWKDYMAPKALNKILEKDLRAKVAMEDFWLEGKNYGYGTIMIPVQNQKLGNADLYEFLKKVSKESSVKISAIQTGMTKGINLGSNQFRAIKPQKVALIVGGSVTSYDAGEIWHLFDQRYDMKITKLDVSDLSRTDLSRYTDIILPSSWGSGIDKEFAPKLKEWTKSGGTIIAYRSAVNWMKEHKFIDFKTKENKMTAQDISFGERGDFRGAQVIGGAIFEVKLDRSHPIAFGYKDDKIAMFRNTTIFMEADEQSYKNPIQYTQKPLLSGYISKPNLDSIASTVPFKHENMGRGEVMLFTDNTNFRAFWYGTNKLLMNAIFFGEEM